MGINYILKMHGNVLDQNCYIPTHVLMLVAWSESLHACVSFVSRIKYLTFMVCSWHSINVQKQGEYKNVLAKTMQ